jgi:hypothetical protein
MKTLVFVAIMIVFVSVFSVGETVRIEAKASYFYPTDAAFREIYGQGLEYGGEISIKIIKSIEVWIGGSRYLRKGKLTLTREATEITISPLFVGLKFLSSGKSAKGYLALGIGKYSYKETNPLNEIDESAWGYLGRVGMILKLFGPLIADFFVGYTHCEVMPAEVKANLGGIHGGIGLGVEF